MSVASSPLLRYIYLHIPLHVHCSCLNFALLNSCLSSVSEYFAFVRLCRSYVNARFLSQERIDALEAAAAAFETERADMIAQTKQYVATMRQANADKTKEIVQKVMNRVYVQLDQAVKAVVAAKQSDAGSAGLSAADFMSEAKATIKATTKLALENPAKLDEEDENEEEEEEEEAPAVEKSAAVDAVGAESVAAIDVEASAPEASSFSLSAAVAEVNAAVAAADTVTAISDLAALMPCGSDSVGTASSVNDDNASDVAPFTQSTLSASSEDAPSVSAEVEHASEQAAAASAAAAAPSAKSSKASRKKK